MEVWQFPEGYDSWESAIIVYATCSLPEYTEEARSNYKGAKVSFPGTVEEPTLDVDCVFQDTNTLKYWKIF